MWFWLGVAIGVLLTVPFAWLALRRGVRKVANLTRRALAAERLAELGTLTGGLAHEIKNPLSTVGLNLQLLREDLKVISNDAELPERLREQMSRTDRRFDTVTRETQRLRDILDDFLKFAGRMKLDLQPTDINALVDELVDFYEPQARASRIHLRTAFDADPAMAQADAALLKQALLNLLINATQAMTAARQTDKPHGGCDELLIRTERRRRMGVEELAVHVIDTGPGIDSEKQTKIFQPYFSTRKGGTGLGLPTTQRIVQEHGGSIQVHSEVGRGTDFTIVLNSEETIRSDDKASM